MTFPMPCVRPDDAFTLGSYVVDRDSIVAFAALYDPQPFHLDEEAASASVFCELVASGLQTLSVMQGLSVRSGMLERIGAVAGLGLDNLRPHNPVRPEDELHGFLDTSDVVPSRSRAGQGVARCRIVATNQRRERVLVDEASILVRLDRLSL